MTVAMNTMTVDQWLQRWNKLMKLEQPEAEQELYSELLKLHDMIERTTERTALRKLLAVLDEVWPQLEARVLHYLTYKTGKA